MDANKNILMLRMTTEKPNDIKLRSFFSKYDPADRHGVVKRMVIAMVDIFGEDWNPEIEGYGVIKQNIGIDTKSNQHIESPIAKTKIEVGKKELVTEPTVVNMDLGGNGLSKFVKE